MRAVDAGRAACAGRGAGGRPVAAVDSSREASPRAPAAPPLLPYRDLQNKTHHVKNGCTPFNRDIKVRLLATDPVTAFCACVLNFGIVPFIWVHYGSLASVVYKLFDN